MAVYLLLKTGQYAKKILLLFSVLFHSNIITKQRHKMQQSSLKSFQILQKLGEGSFSVVYMVRRQDDQKKYAMKKVKIGEMRQKEKQNALNQVRILASIHHPNIINYKDAFFDDRSRSLYIIMELADAGDIQKFINQHIKNTTHFTEAEIWQAIIQMTKGLHALHQKNVLHRDLKTANVFCTSDGRFKLGDLNVSKVAKRGFARTQTGTPYYTSPEIWNDKAYDSKCDIWSLGCVAYEMASLKPPFRASNLKELRYKIQRGLYDNIPSFYSDDLQRFISLCLRVNPSSRPAAQDLLENPSIKRNMPASEMYSHEKNTNKNSLLKTIQVPKNLRCLKQALPGAKYESHADSNKIIEYDQRKSRRANSANNLKPELPKVLVSPKPNDSRKIDFNYKYYRRPISSEQPSNSDRHNEPKSEISELLRGRNGQQVQKMHRNKSVDEIQKSKHSVQQLNKIENCKKAAQKNNGGYFRERVPNCNGMALPRINSREILKDNSRERAREYSRENSRDNIRYNIRENSRERAKEDMEDITNRCKEIENRVKNLMAVRREPTNVASRKYLIPLSGRQKSARQQNNSQKAVYSRNKSIQLARNESGLSNRSNKNVQRHRVPSSDRIRAPSYERYRAPLVSQRRQSSVQKNRIGSMERNNSYKALLAEPKKEMERKNSKKRFAYGVPPRVK